MYRKLELGVKMCEADSEGKSLFVVLEEGEVAEKEDEDEDGDDGDEEEEGLSSSVGAGEIKEGSSSSNVVSSTSGLSVVRVVFDVLPGELAGDEDV